MLFIYSVGLYIKDNIMKDLKEYINEVAKLVDENDKLKAEYEELLAQKKEGKVSFKDLIKDLERIHTKLTTLNKKMSDLKEQFSQDYD